MLKEELDKAILLCEGNHSAAARLLGVTRNKLRYWLQHHKDAEAANARRARYNARVVLDPVDGCVVVFSDAHFWPDEVSLANRALLALLPDLRPWAVINNGDSFDGASISRFPRIGWETKPSVAEELAVNKLRLGEIVAAAPHAQRVWNLGNHDSRFETKLAASAPEFENIYGFHLKDHFPDWEPAWATWIGDEVVIKHRMRGGKYSASNNTLHGGRTVVTGHDHMLWAKAITDYNGTRWGIDAGTLADVWGPMFKDYTEDNVVDWQSGFVVLHFRDGRFTGPEFLHALPDGRVLWRGEVLTV